MIIKAASLPQMSQTVNSIGKYLYKNLSGSVKFKKSSNMFDVWTIVLYQIPYELIKKYNITESKYKEVYEMLININITTYGTKIRVNLIEESPDEYTVGSITINVEKMKSKNPQAYFDDIMESIVDYLVRRLELRYQDYDFLF